MVISEKHHHYPRKFKVLTSICLGYGSHTQNLNPFYYKIHRTGSVLILYSESDNGNVWFVDKNNETGKIESGCANNLVNRGIIEEIDIM